MVTESGASDRTPDLMNSELKLLEETLVEGSKTVQHFNKSNLNVNIMKIKRHTFQKLLLRNKFNYCLRNSYVLSISNHMKLLALLFGGTGGLTGKNIV